MSDAATSPESFVKVGKIKDAHGIRGELFVLLFAGEADWLTKMKDLRLVKENSELPPKFFSVKSARFHKNGMIVKTNELKDRNEAEALKGLVLEIPEAFLVSKPGEAIYLREILGFTVYNDGVLVGPIVKFSSNTAQDLLVVKASSSEVEIPYVKAFTKKVDYKNRKIEMSLPMGLLGEDNEPVVRDGQNEALADEHDDVYSASGDDSPDDSDDKTKDGTGA